MNDPGDYRVAGPDITRRWIDYCRAQLGIKAELNPPAADPETGEIPDVEPPA